MTDNLREDSAALASQLAALRQLSSRWQSIVSDLLASRDEHDQQLLGQAIEQLKAYKDVAAASQALREQVAQHHVSNEPSLALDGTSSEAHGIAGNRDQSTSARSYGDSSSTPRDENDATARMQREDGHQEENVAADRRNSTSSSTSSSVDDSSAADARRAANLRSLSAAMVTANEALASLDASGLTSATPVADVIPHLGGLQRTAQAVADAQWTAQQAFPSLSNATVDADADNEADDEAAAEAAEAAAWAVKSWKRLEHQRNAMRAIAAAAVAEGLKRLGWPPPIDAVPGKWRLASAAAAAGGGDEDVSQLSEAGGDRLAQGCLVLTFLQQWTVQWNKQLVPSSVAASAAMQAATSSSLPVLWSVQIVAKPLINRLRVYTVALLEAAGAAVTVAKDASPVIPPSLWLRGFDPALLLAHAYDTLAAPAAQDSATALSAPPGLAAALGQEGPLQQSFRRGLAAGLLTWHRECNGSLNGATGADVSHRNAARSLTSAALSFDLRSAALEQVLVEAVRILAPGAFSCAAEQLYPQRGGNGSATIRGR